MVVYTLFGDGVQLLTGGTSRLFIGIATASSIVQNGRANPPNRYDQALVRPGVGDWFFPAIPVDGDRQVIDLPAGVDRLGYAIFGNGSLLIGEGTPPVAPPGVTVTTSAGTGSIANGAPLTITWTGNTTATARDWLTVCAAGATIHQYGPGNCFGSVQWVYTDDCSGAGGGLAAVPAGDCAQTAHLGANAPGSYIAFLMHNDTETIIAQSAGFGITA